MTSQLRFEFRRASLIRFRRTPTLSRAKAIAATLSEAWSKAEASFLQSLQDLTGVATTRAPESKPRWHVLSKTVVLDTPRYRGSSTSGLAYDLRACIAICLGDRSSKIWGRVGFPVDQADELEARSTTSSTRFQAAFSSFRALAEAAISHLTSLLSNTGEQYVQQTPGLLEIVTLGASDIDLKDSFDNPVTGEVEAERLLEQTKVRKLFSLCDRAVGLRGSRADTWFSSAVTIRTKDGYLEPRQVLYRVNEDDDAIRVCGLGFDDSRLGELPHQSSRDIAAWIGSHV